MENPTGKERDKLQEVDELLAKAISFRDVSKVQTKLTVISFHSIFDIDVAKIRLR